MPNNPGASPSSPVWPRYSRAYTTRVVLLLTLAYTFNSADRTLIAIIAQPLKTDLKLSDAQLGLLMGTAFATLYAFSGLPIARLAERVSRVRIISIALAVWSCLTALCAAAGSFPQLLLIRMGVGVGEAGCTPPAHSLIGDYVGPARRSTALSVYSCGISAGYILSALVGGYVGMHWGWRAACLVAGAPGLLVSLVLWRFIEEPPRGHAEPDRPVQQAGAWRWRFELRELAATAATLFGDPATRHAVIAIVIATFAAQGSYAFMPAFFHRAFDLSYAAVGVVSALTGGVAVGIGLAAGGLLTDALGSRARRWYALIPALGLVLATPLYVLTVLQGHWAGSAWALAAAGLLMYLSFGPTFAIVQDTIEPQRRATATAVIYIFLTVIGLGCGPLFTGWLIDRLADLNFRHPGLDTVWAPLWQAVDAAASLPAYGTSCLEDARPEGSPVRCHTALALATRQGIGLTVLLYAWAALHYLRAGAALAMRRTTDAHQTGIGR